MNHSKNIPNLFVIGAPKCGTTSMIHYLSQHPAVFVSPIKEPHYFNEDSGHRYYFNLKDYLNLFSDGNDYSYCTEGSVWYLYSQVAVDKILSFNPNAKFIVMLRDPVSMYFSLHQELLFGGSEDQQSPVVAWELQKERKLGNKIPIGCSDPRMLQYGDVCSLGKQLQLAMQKIPKEQLHYVFIDDLKENPDAVYKKVLDFLNVESIALENYAVVNKKKTRKSYALSRFLIATTALKKKLGIKGGLGVANAISRKNVNHNKAIDSDEKSLLEPKLYKYFKNDIALLESITIRDLTHWKQN